MFYIICWQCTTVEATIIMTRVGKFQVETSAHGILETGMMIVFLVLLLIIKFRL